MRSLPAFLLLLLSLTAGPAIAQPATGIRPPPDVSARYQPIYIAPISPAALRYLAQPAVQVELNLNRKQKDMVGKLASLWDISLGEWRERTPRWVPVAAFPAVIAERTDAFLADGLTQEQQTRLNQVVYQLKEREFGAYAAFSMAARDLQLRPDQAEDLTNIKATRVEEILKAVTSAERFEKVKTKVEATNGDTFEKMAEMLTRAQRERLKELKGKAFAARVEFDKTPANVEVRYPAQLFGYHDIELRYLKHPSLRDELRLTEEQAATMDRILTGWEEEYRQSTQVLRLNEDYAASRLHDYTARSLGEYLSDSQRERLGQIMMQRRARASPQAVCGHPSAVSILRLSPMQLEQLEYGRELAEVLTKDQLAKYEKLLGKPFELPTTVNDPFIPAANSPPRKWMPYAFARNFLVRADRLKLSADQVKKLNDLVEDELNIKDLIQKELGYPDVQNVIGAGRGAITADAVREKYQEALEEQCWNVLDPRQQSLAKQLFGHRK
jgi:hypothetical protein